MQPITCQSLNCYLHSVIACATYMGIEEPSAFAELWTEQDFRYDARFDIFLSKRIISAYDCLGARLTLLACGGAEETEQSLFTLAKGAVLIIGMETNYIPWSPVYRVMAGPHYFFAQMKGSGLLSCFDPTYDKRHMPLACGEVVAHAFELFQVDRVTPRPYAPDILREAAQIMRCHPALEEKLLCQIHACAGEHQKDARLLARYVDAMILGRHLFAHYLHHAASMPLKLCMSFDQHFFAKWESVKNGLLKASLMLHNEATLDAVCAQLCGLLRAETELAGAMIKVNAFLR